MLGKKTRIEKLEARADTHDRQISRLMDLSESHDERILKLMRQDEDSSLLSRVKMAHTQNQSEHEDIIRRFETIARRMLVMENTIALLDKRITESNPSETVLTGLSELAADFVGMIREQQECRTD